MPPTKIKALYLREFVESIEYDDGSHTETHIYGAKIWRNAAGNLHRDNGPAVIDADGGKQWYQNGQKHRMDGPAVMRANGEQEWWLNGRPATPVIPIILAAGATLPWHAQPEIAAKLNEPEQKKNIMRWITRTARSGDNAMPAINVLRKIGVKWPELKSVAADIKASKAARINESSYDDGSHTETDVYGNKIWKNAAGNRHRDNGPAMIEPDGSQLWWRNGLIHRDNGPAAIYPDGTEAWYRNANLHRDDGPAYTHPDGRQEWWVDGKLHRDDGPAMIYANGTQIWYRNGQKHRTDGPAVIYSNGSMDWYMNDQYATPLMPLLIAAGAKYPWHAQPEVVARLNQLEEKKNIMRWLTRTLRIGGTAATAIRVLRKIGVDWPELKSLAADAKISETAQITEDDDTPPTEIDSRGSKFWKNAAGQLHREDGPAVAYTDGSEIWYRNGKIHRDNGPAVTTPGGPDSWWLNGKMVNPVEPLLLRAGATKPWHAQSKVVTKLGMPEEKKNVMRLLTRMLRAGDDKSAKTAITVLMKIGVKWPELGDLYSKIAGDDRRDREEHD